MSGDLTIGMAGSGGDGIVSAGESLITAAALKGYYGIMTKSFGPQIRGGESSCRLRIATKPIFNVGGILDVAVALNWEDFLKFGAELPVGSHTIMIYESKTGVSVDMLPIEGEKPEVAMAVPIGEMARLNAGTDQAKNSIVLGILAGWFGIARDAILTGIRKKFKMKGAPIVEANERAFAAGLDYAKSHALPISQQMNPPEARQEGNLVADGNAMCAAAAIFAGCQFFSGYPITPSSEIMQFLDKEIWKYGGIMLQAEDEIAGIGAVVGASFAGKKALTATSGPGMSLKSEMLGLATIAELPLVCVNVQRSGPSTGIPTKGEQADLFQAVFSAHGDTVRPVVAPVNVEDIFGLTIEAFNIAEQFQTPVILLSDQEIAHRKEIISSFDTSKFGLIERLRPAEEELEKYVRFRITENGISPISQPGMYGGNYLASGLEHNEFGAPSASGEFHAKMHDKRIGKLAPLKKRRDLFVIDGDQDAPIGLVSWGSLAGIAMEAFCMGLAQGLKMKLLVPKLLFPVADEIYQEFFASVKSGLVVEQSYQGQLYRLIRMYVDLPAGVKSLAKSGSNPILVSEVLEQLKTMASSLA